MTREFELAGKALIVDDPAGMLARTGVTELHAAHPEARPATSPRTTPDDWQPAPLPNPSDPLQGIAARVMLFERIYHGRLSPAAMVLAWMIIALPMGIVGWGLWGLEMSRYHAPDASSGIIGHILALASAASFPVAALGFLLPGTLTVVIDARRRRQATVCGKGAER